MQMTFDRADPEKNKESVMCPVLFLVHVAPFACTNRFSKNMIGAFSAILARFFKRERKAKQEARSSRSYSDGQQLNRGKRRF